MQDAREAETIKIPTGTSGSNKYSGNRLQYLSSRRRYQPMVLTFMVLQLL
jgi:hypothetical protein